MNWIRMNICGFITDTWASIGVSSEIIIIYIHIIVYNQSNTKFTSILSALTDSLPIKCSWSWTCFDVASIQPTTSALHRKHTSNKQLILTDAYFNYQMSDTVMCLHINIALNSKCCRTKIFKHFDNTDLHRVSMSHPNRRCSLCDHYTPNAVECTSSPFDT